eukprot:1648322-Pyramimonas_sp.AAC.1
MSNAGLQLISVVRMSNAGSSQTPNSSCVPLSTRSAPKRPPSTCTWVTVTYFCRSSTTKTSGTIAASALSRATMTKRSQL